MSEESKSIKDQQPRFTSVTRVCTALQKGNIGPTVTHARGDDGASYLIGYEGTGRATKPVLLWKGSVEDLIKGLLGNNVFKVKDVGVDVNTL